uniref:Water stress and hypersensitive response domain-containing protein n=1 Tax=Kalanchoe fedtschenkoi TaxID=63787 RepID=A0A7N0VDQ2_KALFE
MVNWLVDCFGKVIKGKIVIAAHSHRNVFLSLLFQLPTLHIIFFLPSSLRFLHSHKFSRSDSRLDAKSSAKIHKVAGFEVRSSNSMSTSKKKSWNFNWGSALIGAATATATAAVLVAKPKDPKFHLISIDLKSLKLNFPALDAEMLLRVHVTNPNVVPINYSSTTMSIYYEGSMLGAAKVEAGSQARNSCETLRLPTRLSGMELAHHAGKFLEDVRRREMLLDAAVDIEGTARVLLWDHKFKVHVDSRIVVDPVLLDIIDQENKAALQLFAG